MEEFYSLQGEGFQTGQVAWFIRIGGCDVGCHWCDVKESWDSAKYPPLPVDPLVQRAASCPAKAVVVTGGEPLLYNLDYLCQRLKAYSITTFLETSGSAPLSGIWDWICLSSKKEAPPRDEILSLANELKVIIECQDDFDWAEKNAGLVNNQCKLYLQPEWSVSESVTPVIVEYIKDHPEWRISLQSHKFMGIP